MKNLIKWTRWEFSFGNTRVWRFIFLICTRFRWSLEWLVFVEGGKIEEPKTLRAFQTLTARDYIFYFGFFPLLLLYFHRPPPSFLLFLVFPLFIPYFPSQPLLLILFPPLSTPPPPTHTFFYFTSLPLLSEETNWISLYIPVTVSLLNQ